MSFFNPTYITLFNSTFFNSIIENCNDLDNHDEKDEAIIHIKNLYNYCVDLTESNEVKQNITEFDIEFIGSDYIAYLNRLVGKTVTEIDNTINEYLEIIKLNKNDTKFYKALNLIKQHVRMNELSMFYSDHFDILKNYIDKSDINHLQLCDIQDIPLIKTFINLAVLDIQPHELKDLSLIHI